MTRTEKVKKGLEKTYGFMKWADKLIFGEDWAKTTPQKTKKSKKKRKKKKRTIIIVED